MMTFLAPPFKCCEAFSVAKNTPVDSQTVATPCSPHGIFDGSFSEYNLTFCPLIITPCSKS